MSASLAAMLRKSTTLYQERWVARSETEYATPARAGIVEEHIGYWEAIARAVETQDFEELMSFARTAGRMQARDGRDLADAVRRTIAATNLIELALLEVNDGDVPAIDIVNEIGDVRGLIAMAVAEGYKAEVAERDAPAEARERLRAAMQRRRDRAATTTLLAGSEIAPLYEGGMRLHFVESGKLRLYNLLPNGRTITLSILSENDVFLQWRAESTSLSCLCAEAMHDSTVLTVDGDALAEIVAQQPVAAIDVITQFAQRLTESQVLIEDLLNNSVNIRLYRTLLQLAQQFGRLDAGATLIDVPLTHQRLADMIGSNRVTVTRKLHELQERGIVEGRRNATLAVRRMDRLEALATGAETD
ncbi:hypothetical protein WPS_24930 [Vulcanimicrobium alpinum]|uniref:HTH crp-type domain-containing protein n=1 Tax=Vulcanimicrobium alpinum TaxID=3016050 RepID=A0AAN1XXJ2_UNVUL|nr:Crp/Fnr family transcriptional regulator [Vulcanimicrobium alpinum]BDE07217.1 hypothetical protein WPS_24930 [Vulcanimicrobium alpinum]